MRPSGPLSTQIYNFWDEGQKIGRNAAQNLMPHITLCSYFKVGAEHSSRLGEMLVSAATSVLSSSALLLPLPLEKYCSQNYMGLFVTAPAAPVLQAIKRHFLQAAASVCSGLEASSSSSGGGGSVVSSSSATEEDLHLTLAYSYSATQYPGLEALLQGVHVKAPASWELCLYSRESRFNGLELYRCHRGQDPSHSDSLSLLTGDYVYVSAEAVSACSDGWVTGTSWLTGCSGLVPLNCLVRVPESDTWTLHRGLTITSDGKNIEMTDGTPAHDKLFDDSCEGYSSSSIAGTTSTAIAAPDPSKSPGVQQSGLSLSLLNLLDHSEGSRRSTIVHSDANCSDRLQSLGTTLESGVSVTAATTDVQYHRTQLTQQQIDQLYAKVNKGPRKLSPLYNFPIAGPRKLIVMRHGERADFTFGEWHQICFNEAGLYSRADLNLQPKVPVRKDSPHSFGKDCPLTRVGELQAQLVGEGFTATHTPIHHVFCSPALRCVMTATSVLRAMNIADRLPLKIEPGLFEWLAWYHEGVPQFMSLEELVAAGFNIDMNYRHVLPVTRLVPEESCEQYYTRSGRVSNALLTATRLQGGTVLLVAHAASLDTCTKQLIGGHPRNSTNMTSLLKKVPYCALSSAEESPTDGLWSLVEPPFRSPTHCANHTYDWTIWRQ
uniref:Ubiquitin-associated and SH3 domain-containing protein B-like n=1 Tax=Hirondellea gigas TaxID=1518452 RepID=A0A6A7FZ44_9CRUS